MSRSSTSESRSRSRTEKDRRNKLRRSEEQEEGRPAEAIVAVEVIIVLPEDPGRVLVLEGGETEKNQDPIAKKKKFPGIRTAKKWKHDMYPNPSIRKIRVERKEKAQEKGIFQFEFQLIRQ
jgi:hypothetical protein